MKTELTNFNYLIAILEDTTPLKNSEEPIPVVIKAMDYKPYLGIGPFWIKTNKGAYDVYVWDRLVGKLRWRVTISFDKENRRREDKFCDSVKDVNNWWIL